MRESYPYRFSVVMEALDEILGSIRFLVKDSSYEHEKERRLIMRRHLRHADDFNPIPVSDHEWLTRYSLISGNQVAVDEIILGPNVKEAHYVEADLRYRLTKMKSNALFRGLHMEGLVTKSSIPYR